LPARFSSSADFITAHRRLLLTNAALIAERGTES